MSQTSASIVMRSFNEAWALRETLPALRQQAFQAWELIVIDSGSTDGSQALLRAAQPAHYAQLTPGGPDDLSFLRTVAFGWLQDVRKDFALCARHRRLSEWLHAARIPWSQRVGRLNGFRQGWTNYRSQPLPSAFRTPNPT